MSLAMLLAAPETCSDEAASSSEAAESSTALVETSLTMRIWPSIMVLKDWLSWPISSAAWLDERMVKLLQKSLVQKKKGGGGQELYFSKRELEVLAALCDGLNTPEIAERLFISPRTVETHKQNLMEKTQSRHSVELAMYAIKNGLIDINPLIG